MQEVGRKRAEEQPPLWAGEAEPVGRRASRMADRRAVEWGPGDRAAGRLDSHALAGSIPLHTSNAAILLATFQVGHQYTGTIKCEPNWKQLVIMNLGMVLHSQGRAKQRAGQGIGRIDLSSN